MCNVAYVTQIDWMEEDEAEAWKAKLHLPPGGRAAPHVPESHNLAGLIAFMGGAPPGAAGAGAA